jgi:serine protease Do
MLVESVEPGSPARQAGLKPGDIVLSINGQSVDGRYPEQLPLLRDRIAQLPPGSELLLEVKAQPTEPPKQLRLQTEPLLSRVGQKSAYVDWGLSVQKLSRALAREQKRPNADGVRVLGIQPGYPAALAELRRGDLIVSINRKPLRQLSDMQKAYEAFQAGPKELLLEISRNHQTLYKVLEPQTANLDR